MVEDSHRHLSIPKSPFLRTAGIIRENSPSYQSTIKFHYSRVSQDDERFPVDSLQKLNDNQSETS